MCRHQNVGMYTFPSCPSVLLLTKLFNSFENKNKKKKTVQSDDGTNRNIFQVFYSWCLIDLMISWALLFSLIIKRAIAICWKRVIISAFCQRGCKLQLLDSLCEIAIDTSARHVSLGSISSGKHQGSLWQGKLLLWIISCFAAYEMCLSYLFCGLYLLPIAQ